MKTNFGQLFQGFLDERSLTQAQAAALLGWKQQTVQYYCKKESPPRPHIIVHMAEKLNLDMVKLAVTGHGMEGGYETRSADPMTALHKQITELKRENADLRKQLAAIKKVLNPKS